MFLDELQWKPLDNQKTYVPTYFCQDLHSFSLKKEQKICKEMFFFGNRWHFNIDWLNLCWKWLKSAGVCCLSLPDKEETLHMRWDTGAFSIHISLGFWRQSTAFKLGHWKRSQPTPKLLISNSVVSLGLDFLEPCFTFLILQQ